MNPVESSLRTRSEVERAVVELVEPLLAHVSPGGARVRPTATGAHFPDVAAELEGFARPLWGVVPLGVHADFGHWETVRAGLVHGTDPSHDEYWGTAGDYSQKHVEMAAVGVGLALTPERLWEPLSANERERLVAWLTQVNDADLHDNNWLFFRVMVNVGLRAVGARHDWEGTQESLDRLESFYRGDGWYTDGPADEGAVDYYLPWAMHLYGLLYAHLAGDEDPERAERFRSRAAAFATHHVDWFDDEGRAIPYGRSLTYRFAQAAFWGALALGDAKPDALSWGEVRGLWARNVRWWLDQPVFTDGGLLSVGYRYPTLKTSESYNSPNSPYWALKAFLPLALPADHAFWRADEAPLPDRPDVTAQPEAGKVLCRSGSDEGGDADHDHLFALSVPQESVHGREKYTKFAYSARFGFSVASRRPGPGRAGHDGALALSLDGERYATPATATDTAVDGTTLTTRWEPWDGVSVRTWLAPHLPWHVRVHRVETDRTLHAEEGGFPLDRTGDDEGAYTHRTEGATALARYPAGVSCIADGFGGREPTVVAAEPNTNLLHPRTVVPTLRGTYQPGTHWTAAAVAASPGAEAAPDGRPTFAVDGDAAVVETPDGETLLRCSPSDR
ncbi:DUF2264 domain-containing protein [Candidatus Halobonum tyrrellensis]|uniref:DUF2264 domain-containing protein n=1 Tax=Candidatus Halobonum tyrrellensis G22 TaxID=1324957 RepID=V4GNS3_9EURY|nr:DUF2264 domain-containing protein [Candidatus Halobonum tyrrellensis]ESP87041.1 hypothetical protein K933_16017 [Candidatus Halobonum tyrrellensis G22]